MEFSRPEYCSGEPFPSPGHLSNPGIEPRSPTLQADSLPAEPRRKPSMYTVQFSSVAQLCPTFATPRTAAQQASLSITNSQSSPKPTSTESVMPSSHRILCRPLPLLSSVMQTARYKRSSETTLCIVQFSQSCPTVCDPMDYSTPGLPVHHQLPEFTQTHLH